MADDPELLQKALLNRAHEEFARYLEVAQRSFIPRSSWCVMEQATASLRISLSRIDKLAQKDCIAPATLIYFVGWHNSRALYVFASEFKTVDPIFQHGRETVAAIHRCILVRDSE